MKKSLLFIASVALSLGATAQMVPSPFWTTQNSNYSTTAASSGMMDAVDANVVWALMNDGTTANYNEFTRTINGGTTYTSGPVYASTGTNQFSSIEGVSANTAWVTSYLLPGNNMGAIHSTTNGGVTWTNMTAANMYTNAAAFADFTCFLTPTIGITVGDPVGGELEIHRTTNGGATWAAIAGSNIPNPISASEFALTDSYTKLGTNDIWFGTSTGRIFHSADQGQTWTVGTTGAATAFISKLAFRDALNGIVFTNSGAAYRTTNGGGTWSQITPIDPNMGRSGISAIPGTNIYASCGYQVGNQKLSYSSDDGSTWTDWGSLNIEYYDIDFISNSVGFASGTSDVSTASIDGMYKYTGGPVGINSIGAPHATIEMYPNPSSGIVTLNLNPSKHGGATLSVIDAMGKTVYSENLNNGGFEKHTLNLEHLAKGIYSVNIIRPSGLDTQKIIIQ